MSTLTYLFYPNPGASSYDNPKVLALFALCGFLVIFSFIIRYWRKHQKNPVTKKLSTSWSRAAFWFGIVGLVLVVARVEPIQYIAMRVWWIVWAVAILLYIVFQVRVFRLRHYTVVPKDRTEQEGRDPYLPKKKRRK